MGTIALICKKCYEENYMEIPPEYHVDVDSKEWKCTRCGTVHVGYEKKNAGPVPGSDEIQIGKKYKHFRSGGVYVVLGLATLEEDLDTLVIYAEWNPIDGLSKKVWARRKSVFFELVEDPNVPASELKMPDLKRPLVPRFQLWSEATTGENVVSTISVRERLMNGTLKADKNMRLAEPTTESMIPGCAWAYETNMCKTCTEKTCKPLK